MLLPRAVSGLWGEGLVVMKLRHMGCEVEWDGGQTRDRDLRAGCASRDFHVQVKTSTAEDGRIAWRGSGARAVEWASDVERLGMRAIFVLVHFPTAAEADFDLDRGLFQIQLPEDAKVSVASAHAFAAIVDIERELYGQRARRRVGRNGEKIGDFLSPDGLAYPLLASQFPALNRTNLKRALARPRKIR